jgi:hypothetical protein
MRTFAFLMVVAVTAPAARAQLQFQQDRALANDMKQIGLAWHNFHDANNRGPKDADELAPYFENSKKLLDSLRTKRIDFAFGVSINDLKEKGLSNVILGHEKDAATKGGLALFGDGSVRKLSAADFAKAPKAKKDE